MFGQFSLWLLCAYACLLAGSIGAQEAKVRYAIAIHGGAGGDPRLWSAEFRQQRLDGLNAALDQGAGLLKNGERALDVVEKVVRTLENNPVFNAGRGCVLNENGQHELDASIMDGKELRCGAVASVRTTKNPVSLARLVMTETRHVLLMGQGADDFGKAMNVEQASDAYFRTDRQIENWRQWKEMQEKTSQYPTRRAPQSAYLGTVGCVVLDTHNDLAAATSTGGLKGKRWGRVGDSPIIGAGCYADNGTCAVSGTGIGEEFIRRSVASDIAARIRYGHQRLSEAAQATLATLPDQSGGVITVDTQGTIAVHFNTLGMSRAFADSNGKRGVFLGRENETTKSSSQP